jgi:hypothetical protein
MSQRDMIGLLIGAAVASLIIRLLIANTYFGTKVNETAGKLF